MESNRVEEVQYHGIGGGAGPRPIVVEDNAGLELGVVHHVVKHSPTGLSWGYAGSGPADTARSLLIAALGDKARCPACLGTRKIVYDSPADAASRPYDRERDSELPIDPDEDEYDGPAVTRCYDCEDGYRRLPYQDFKFQFVAGWGREWRMSRPEILEWLAQHGIRA